MVILKIIYKFDFGPPLPPKAVKGPLRRFMTARQAIHTAPLFCMVVAPDGAS